MSSDPISPDHYKLMTTEQVNAAMRRNGGGIEAIDIIDAVQLDNSLNNVLKYLLRAGKKKDAPMLQEVMKAQFYLDHYIQLEEEIWQSSSATIATEPGSST